MAATEQCISNYRYFFSADLLKDKVAFITGGGSGIGFTIAEVFMRHQCHVVIASRKLEKLESAAAQLEKATGGKCTVIKMDVRNPKDISDAVEQTLSKFKKIDILVNNAAGNFLAPVTGLSFNAFKTVMEIDAHGTFNVSKLVFEKSMQKQGGVIINISATLQYRGTVMQTHAAAAKAAIDSMTRSMAVEWGSKNVRVVGIAPGPIGDTEGMRRLGSKRSADMIKMIVPLKRAGEKAEIAHAALFLASGASAYTTGHTMVVDGGAWLSEPNFVAMHEMVAKL